MLEQLLHFSAQTIPGSGGINVDLFGIGGVIQNGVYATIGWALGLVFVFLIVVLVGYSIFAGLKILTSQGNPEGMESGMKTIKNIWIGLAMGLGFMIVLSLIGVLFGFGSVLQWSQNLAQCNGVGGQFMFQEVNSSDVDKLVKDGATDVFVGCCPAGAGGVKIWFVADLSHGIPPGFETSATGCTVSTHVTK